MTVFSLAGVGQYADYQDGMNFRYPTGQVMLALGKPGLGFFGGPPNAKQNITGALSAVTDSNAKAVLTSIIAALGQYTLVNNNTT